MSNLSTSENSRGVFKYRTVNLGDTMRATGDAADSILAKIGIVGVSLGIYKFNQPMLALRSKR